MKRKPPIDPDLQQIDDYERALLRLHDERVLYGAPADEIKAQRHGVVRLVATIAERMRADLAIRRRHA